MFDAEKLLGTILREVAGSANSGSLWGKKKGRHGNALLDGLTSGAGLMTVLGLGIGAYEILSGKEQGQPAAQAAACPPPPPVPGLPADGRQAGPPPPPPAGSRPVADLTPQDLALRMIRVMIAAAHADGTLDETEERAVLNRLDKADLSAEERNFILAELHNPIPIAALAANIAEPATARTMYALALSTVDLDSIAERRWFDELAIGLGLSRAEQVSLEQQR